jgi:undecaprenyl-diphosphatase
MSPNIIQTLILGFIQGITEFLPISSSGHLIVVPNLVGLKENLLVFDVILHLGTALAIFIYFFKELWGICEAFFSDITKEGTKINEYSQKSLLGIKIVVGSLPAVVLGLLFEDLFEDKFRTVVFVSAFLLLGSLLMLLAELVINKRMNSKNDPGENYSDIENISYYKAFVVGIFQAFALFPGISRSGSTISAGILSGFDREAAARFSFLLSVPIVVAAAIYKITTSYSQLILIEPKIIIIGFLSSFFFGLISIKFLLKFLKENKLSLFIVYRIVLSIVLILFFI